MDWAIHLNHQARFWAIEINNKTVNRMLPAEFKSIHLPATQLLPQ